MFFLLFLFLFSIDSTAGELTLWQSFGEHVKEFPVKEVVWQNILPAAAIMVINVPICQKKIREFLPTWSADFVVPAVETICNVQSAAITFPFRVLYKAQPKLEMLLNRPNSSAYSAANKGLELLNSFFFWPMKVKNKFSFFVWKHTTKRERWIGSDRTNVERWGKKSYYLRNSINVSYLGMHTIIKLMWYSFLVYQWPWLWKQMQRIPATNIFTFSYRYGKKKFAAYRMKA